MANWGSEEWRQTEHNWGVWTQDMDAQQFMDFCRELLGRQGISAEEAVDAYLEDRAAAELSGSDWRAAYEEGRMRDGMLRYLDETRHEWA